MDANVLLSSASSSDLMPTSDVGGGAYGMRTLRSLRNAKPSGRLQKKMDVTYNYFLEEVDPVIGDCITYLLCTQPRDVPVAMLAYLRKKAAKIKAKQPTTGSSSSGSGGAQQQQEEEEEEERLEQEQEGSAGRAKPKREQKLYLAMSIGPVVAKLVNRVAIARPKRVVDFLCRELQLMVSGTIEAAAGDSEEPNCDELDDRFVIYGSFVPNSARLGQRREAGLPPTDLPAPDVALYPAPETEGAPGAGQDTECGPAAGEAETAVSAPVVSSSSSAAVSQPNLAPSPEPAPPAVVVRKLQLALLGADGAGKSSILNVVQGKGEVKTRPTIGFRPVELMLDEATKVRFYDLGGGARIRDIWEQYYHDVHAVVYVVDASEAKAERWDEACALMRATLASPYLAGKPLLLLCNKADLEGCRDVEACCTALGVRPSADGLTSVVACSAAHVPDQPADERIEAALEAILGVVQARYDGLHQRVEGDTLLKAREDAKRRLQRERKVLRSKIAAAFPDQVAEQFRPEQAGSAEDAFTEEEGVTFLSAEIGVDAADLPPTALAIASSVGYQRLALQIIGGLRAPISNKKEPMGWEDIRLLVDELRAELGL